MFLKIILDPHSLKNAANYDSKQVDNINLPWEMPTAARKDILKKHNAEQIDDFKIKFPKKTRLTSSKKTTFNDITKNQKHIEKTLIVRVVKLEFDKYVRSPVKNAEKNTELKKSEQVKKEIKVIETKLRRLNRKKQIFSVTKKTHEREKNVLSMLRKSRVPIFKVVPQREREAPYKRRNFKDDLSNVKVVNDIMVNTSQYIEPTLHFIVKYPNQSSYLFNYGNNCLKPQIKELPNEIYERNNTIEGQLFDNYKNYKSNRKSLRQRKILRSRKNNIKRLCGRKSLGSNETIEQLFDDNNYKSNRKSLRRRKILHGRKIRLNVKSLCGRKNLSSKKSLCGSRNIINPKIHMNTQEKIIDNNNCYHENVTNNNDCFTTYCHDKLCTAADMNRSISNENMTSTEKLKSLLQQLKHHMEYLKIPTYCSIFKKANQKKLQRIMC